jgi:hypothetical protein
MVIYACFFRSPRVFNFRERDDLSLSKGVVMEYQLVFAPGLEIVLTDFVATWNEEESTQEVAQAQLVSSTTRSFGEPMLGAVWLVVSTVGLGLGTNVLYDLIKSAVMKQKTSKRTKITKLDQPDGTHLLIIEEEE